MKQSHSHIEVAMYRLFEITPVPIILSFPDGKIEYANPALINLLGYDEEQIYQDDIIITHHDDIAMNRKIRSNLQSDPHTPVQIEKRYVHESGRTVHAQLNIVAQCDKKGNIQRYISQLFDLSSIKQSDSADILLNYLVNHSNDAIYVIDPKYGHILNCNLLAYRRLGYKKEELLQLTVADIHPDFKLKNNWQSHQEKIMQRHFIILESTHIRKDQTKFPVEANISYIKYNDAEYLLAIVRDISRRKKREREAIERSNLDPLTNLPNRRLLEQKLERTFTKAKQSHKFIAFMYIDLDNFKDINDTYGHSVGDAILVGTAKRLQHCVRQSDIVSRLGGDEFLVVMDNLEDKSLVPLLANKVLNEFKKPFKIQTHLLDAEASIGVSIYLNNGCNIQALIQLADEAMYQAKKESGASVYYI
ncbi:MAG: diguanylate cyclase [Alteromonadales bacterium]|nr:diguanylate cyclase [Alteromonadales bacterium]